MNAVKVKGYLMHLTHYDPAWVKLKHLEKRFSLPLALSLVDEIARAGLNTVIIDVEDAVLYKSHPELRRAYSAPMSDYRRLVTHALKKGLTVVPKLNFAKGTDVHNAWMSPYDEFPDTPAYFDRAMMLVDELIKGLDIGAIHIGMDEDDRGNREFLHTIKELHRRLAERKLRTIMWADVGHMWAPVRHAKFKAVLPSIPRDVVMIPWNYDLVSLRRWVRLMAGMGFAVWGGTGPAGGKYAEMTEPNMRMWAKDIKLGGGNGLVATFWQPLKTANAKAMRQAIREAGRLFTE